MNDYAVHVSVYMYKLLSKDLHNKTSNTVSPERIEAG